MTKVEQFGASLNHNDTLTELHAEFKTTQSTGGGVKTYAQLPDKPKINSVTVEGDKSSADLHIRERHDEISSQQILNLFQ